MKKNKPIPDSILGGVRDLSFPDDLVYEANIKEMANWIAELRLENKDLKEKIAIITKLLMEKNNAL